MPIKEEAVQVLVDWHFQTEPEIREVYRILGRDEEDPQEPIKLLEVSNATLTSGHVVPFGFAKTDEIPYPTIIATVTPEEMQDIRQRRMPLPPGWSLERSEHYLSPASSNGAGHY